MQDITETMWHYRKCRLDTWNNHIQPQITRPEHAFINVNLALFEAYFLDAGGTYNLIEKTTNLLIKPSNKNSFFYRQGEQSGWENETNSQKINDSFLVFINFFDFANSWSKQKYEYVFCCDTKNIESQYLIPFDSSHKFYIDKRSNYSFLA